MDEISVAVRSGTERQKKTMSEALVEVLRADIGSPLELLDHADSCGKRAKCIFDLLDLRGSGGVFEFEKDDVAQGFWLRARLANYAQGAESKEKQHGDCSKLSVLE